MRTRFLGRVMSVLVVLGLAGLLAAPVFANSSITNDLTVTPRTFGDSITVDVVVYAERGLRQSSLGGTVEKVAESTLTYVAIDASYRKRPVPPETR